MKRLLLTALALTLAAPAHADTLIDNVNGITLDKDGKLVRFTGLVIDREGKVKQLLDRKDKRPERPDFKQDGQGKTLIPGLIDAHGHVLGRSEARRVGKECVRPWRSRGSTAA